MREFDSVTFSDH